MPKMLYDPEAEKANNIPNGNISPKIWKLFLGVMGFFVILAILVGLFG